MTTHSESLLPETVRSGSESLRPPLAGPPPAPPNVARIARLAGWTEFRMRFQRALNAFAIAAIFALLAVIFVLVLVKLERMTDGLARKWLWAIGTAPIVVSVVAALRRLPPLAGAIALDKQAGLSDRLSTALSFSKEKTPSPFMVEAIADGVAHVRQAKPAKAFPLAIPRDFAMVVALVMIAYSVTLLEIRKHREEASTPPIHALLLDPDEIELLKDVARNLQNQPELDNVTHAAAEEFAKLTDDIRNRKLDREAVFRRLQNIEQGLERKSELDRQALEDAMKKVADSLKKNPVTKELGEQLEKGDKKAAELKMRELAKALANGTLKLDPAQKEALAKALRDAANRDREKDLADMKAKREAVEAELEKMKQEREKNGGKETADQERDRKNKERQLDRLSRDEEQRASADRQLERLDRDLDKAAEDLLKEAGLTPEDLGAGAEEINRFAREDMTEKQREELRQRLEELRQKIIQQGKLTDEQKKQLRDFAKHARGHKSGGRKPGKHGQGQQGQNGQPQPGGQDGQDQQGQEGDDGEEESVSIGVTASQGEGSGDSGDHERGQNGEGQGQNGQGQGENGQGQGQNGNGGNGGTDPSKGPGWGTGHDPSLEGQRTGLAHKNSDTQVTGANNRGPTRSEVIRSAADRGFVGSGYKRVYAEYKTVAEEALKQDEIPAGYRFYVRRYFDKIRPRN